MDKKEQLNRDKNAIEGLGNLYNHVNKQIVAIRYLTDDLNFEVKIPDQQERYLMMHELEAHEQVRSCIMNRIRFYRNRVKANKPEPWEEPDNGIKDWSQFKKTDSIYIGVDVSNEGDRACCQVWGDNITAQHHCGQDAKEEAHVSLNELLGMEVIGIGGSEMKCEDCSLNCDNCVKVELVGGDYLCLAEPEQDKPNVINFDEENNDILCGTMQEIKEKVDDFMDYLDSVVNG